MKKQKVFFLYLILFFNFIDGSCVDTINLVDFLINQVHLDSFLKESRLYTKTNPIFIRSLHTLPIIQQGMEADDLYISIRPFYIAMLDGVDFGKDEFFYTNAVNLAEISPDNIFSKNRDLFDILALQNQKLLKINFPLLGSLFDSMKINQQRVGFLGEIQKNFFDTIFFTLKIPFIYQIHYPEVTDEVNDRIADELSILSGNDYENTAFNAEDFIKKHMVADFFGIDDIYLNFKYRLYNKICYDVDLALSFIIPNSMFYSNGIIGGDYSKIKDKKINFDWMKPYQYFLSSFSTPCFDDKKGKEEFKIYFSDMLDVITDALYNMNYEKKFYSMSPSLHMLFKVKNNLNIHWNIFYYKNFTQRKNRYIRLDLPEDEFNKNWASTNESIAAKNLDFLNTATTNYLFLKPVKCEVSPGDEIQVNYFFEVYDPSISIMFGFDAWYKFAERLKCISNIPYATFCTRKDPAYQLKLYSSLKNSFNCNNFFLAIFTEFTIVSSGIGFENGISAEIGYSF